MVRMREGGAGLGLDVVYQAYLPTNTLACLGRMNEASISYGFGLFGFAC
jgi:hypothetical protein